jgi:hypothetical protein
MLKVPVKLMTAYMHTCVHMYKNRLVENVSIFLAKK